ncbi:MAG: peptidase M15 [bacterium]|nr:peptidase M15 [bacterium]
MMAKHFTAKEIEGLNPMLVERLDWAREQSGVPFTITSGYRPGDPKAHGKGLAVDIRCSQSMPRFRMIQALQNVGFRRIGVYNLHVHADVAEEPDFPQDVMWWGESD